MCHAVVITHTALFPRGVGECRRPGRVCDGAGAAGRAGAHQVRVVGRVLYLPQRRVSDHRANVLGEEVLDGLKG